MTICGTDNPLHNRIQKLQLPTCNLLVWISQQSPQEKCDIWMRDCDGGRCWNVVDNAVQQRESMNLFAVCCCNLSVGVGGSVMHFVVNAHGCKWFTDERELMYYLSGTGESL